MNGVNGSDCLDYVEIDPTGRYGRYNEILGKGASKTVYKGFDEYEGIEVAWNQVKLYDFLQSPEDLERLYCEIHLLKTLKHRNLMKFYTSWVDVSKRNINFVTEMFTSGTLRQYRQKHKRVNLRAVKNWCRQILSGLLYLHSHDPPIIHRDLKCDNIFVNGNTGEVKIGDLGLAAILRKSHAVNCVGTPEFMAPEVYEEEYNELVDIYSFGMCVLEMVTFEYPYSECTHPVQIYKKVISGTKPEALYKVSDPSIREFVSKCLTTAQNRLSAQQLLMDPFLQPDPLSPPLLNSTNYRGSLVNLPSFNNLDCNYKGNSVKSPSNNEEDEECYCWENDENTLGIEEAHKGIDLFHGQEEEEDELVNLDVSIKGKRKDDGGIFLRLRISDKDARVRNIYFPFDTETDTALTVATEMVAELDITDHEVTRISDMIDGEVSLLVPGWRPGPGIEEINNNNNNDTSNDNMSGSYCEKCASNVSSCGSLLDYIALEGHCTNVECKQAMRGRFEEVTYQVDDLDQDPVKEVDLEPVKELDLPAVKARKNGHSRKLSLVTLGKIESFHLGTNNSYRVPFSEMDTGVDTGLDLIGSNGFYSRTMSMR